MTVGAIIEALDNLGVNVELGISCNSKMKPDPEAESLIKMLSDQRDAAIDYLLIGKLVPLPDDTKLPAQFRSERMNQIRNIFAICYRMLDLYEGSKTLEQWREVHAYHEGRLDEKDPLAVAMHTVCVEELRRQYKESGAKT